MIHSKILRISVRMASTCAHSLVPRPVRMGLGMRLCALPKTHCTIHTLMSLTPTLASQARPTSAIREGLVNQQARPTSAIREGLVNQQARPTSAIREGLVNQQARPTSAIREGLVNQQARPTSAIREGLVNQQARPTSAIREGLVNCVYKLCPTGMQLAG